MRRIKKVKIAKGNKISIIWEVENQLGEWDEFSFTRSAKATGSFYEAMEALKPHVREMCELPAEYENRITVKGVSVSYGGEAEVMGATIIAAMKLNHSNCDLNLNTPHKASASYSGQPADEFQVMTEECIEALEDLYEQCELYIDGKRAQGEIFEEEGKSS